jgi:serine/threonine protein kinase
VKGANILLNAKLEAKIADFGLTKAYRDDATHMSTNTLVGTLGYVDPEYANPTALYHKPFTQLLHFQFSILDFQKKNQF